MTDTPQDDGLVERLRNRPNDAPMPTERLLDEAADRIAALRAENEALREALADFAVTLAMVRASASDPAMWEESAAHIFAECSKPLASARALLGSKPHEPG